MESIAIARISDFDKISIKSYSILGRKVGIIKRDDGSYYATEAACKHQGADLTAGTIENNIATCPRHKWQYDLETGQCLNHDSPPLRRFLLVIDNDTIKISTAPVE
jgi:nitrite reductase/ring-hydroxylating ferredoxin subunit